jgi:hypothetical protein
MSIGRRKQKEEWQARTATDEGMNAEAAQERTRMVSGSVPEGGIRITGLQARMGALSMIRSRVYGLRTSSPGESQDIGTMHLFHVLMLYCK